ncbi:MAG: 8-oxoguanine DNA glycosylase [Planctomycetota bacterium]
MNGRLCYLDLPASNIEVLPGVRWGAFDHIFSPAFWACRAWLDQGKTTASHYRLGASLGEEVAACLLGGYGMPAQVGVAAYHRLRAEGLLDGVPTAAELERRLSEPLRVGDRWVKYRFPKQKSLYLSTALSVLQRTQPPAADRELRDWLTTLPGIGLKTASWITRNWLGSDRVAIVDIHILRAGRAAGFFLQDWVPARHYRLLEAQFLAFAQALGVRASTLDHLIWHHMRLLGNLAHGKTA